MRSYLDNLSARERGLIFGALALSLAALLYFAAIRPWIQHRASIYAAHQTALRDYGYVKSSAPLLQQARSFGPRAKFERTALIAAARENGLSVSRVQPAGDLGLTIWFDGVQSAALFQMLRDLEARFDLSISALAVSPSQLGGVSAQITLTGQK